MMSFHTSFFVKKTFPDNSAQYQEFCRLFGDARDNREDKTIFDRVGTLVKFIEEHQRLLLSLKAIFHDVEDEIALDLTFNKENVEDHKNSFRIWYDQHP